MKCSPFLMDKNWCPDSFFITEYFLGKYFKINVVNVDQTADKILLYQQSEKAA